jgi:ABC-type branched-subunit amino acid transport system substrate-binding protein
MQRGSRHLHRAAGARTARRPFLLQAAALAAAVAAPGMAMAQAARPAVRRVVLGQSVPLTGAADQIGLAFAGGAKLYIDAANERARQGGGWTLELRQLDDGYDPAKAGENARKLLDEGAELLFGFLGTGSADAAAAVARQRGALLFAPFAASDALREPAAAHVFHVRPSMIDEALKIARHCATLGWQRVAVVAEDDAMGRAGLAAITQALAELKMQPPVATVTVPVGSDRVDAQVAQLARAQPQAVVQASLFNTTAAVIRKLRRTGYAGAFLNFSVVGIDPLFAALGKEIAGVVISQVVPSPRSTAMPLVREYLAAIDKSDQIPSYENLEGYVAAKSLWEAIRRNGGKADAGLQRTMAAMGDYDVGGFRINLRPGVRDPSRPIDLVTITADGRVLR